jgi:hypothetical protein
VAISLQGILDLIDLETRLVEQLRSMNKTRPPEFDAPYWLAEQTSRRRIDALTILSGGVAPDPTAPLLRVAFAGSSTYEKYGTDGTNLTVSNATRSTDGVNFGPMGTTGNGLLAYAAIVGRRTGRPMQFLMAARGGSTTANDWLPDSSSLRATLVQGIKNMAGCELVNWACDFNDLFTNIVVDYVTAVANLRGVFAKVRSETGLPNLRFTVGVSQRYDGGNAVAPDPKWTAVRAAEMAVALDANIAFGTHWYDFPQVSDRIHLTDVSYPAHAARLAENGLALMGLAGAVLERGPSVTAVAARYSNVTRVTIAHSTGTDFTPTTGITGFQVSFDGGATWSPATGARVDAVTLDLSHADSGGASPLVQAYAGRAPNVLSVLHDNSPRQLPLNPTSTPLQSPNGSTTPAPAAPGTKRMLVAFSKTNAAPSGFNAFHDSGTQAGNSNAGLTIALLDVNGAATGWTLTTANAFSAGVDNQGTQSGTRYPAIATNGYWYNGASQNGDNGGVNAPMTTLVLTAPSADYAKTVELDLFGARSAADRKVSYAAGSKAAQVIDAGANDTAIATFTGLTLDSNGQVAFSFAPASGYTYGYLNVAEIRVLA